MITHVQQHTQNTALCILCLSPSWDNLNLKMKKSSNLIKKNNREKTHHPEHKLQYQLVLLQSTWIYLD